ncbi:hypothetical protein KUTeg_017116 [Tegillarca granosa]|uniref:Bifunctional polynucleotide phosphatase/kinase n=1 Tax=Tegillarca granosa TaxID=220873 RepID=A0ABQ9EQC9_TEGGR|nr:hypothetical protein KUTeg_017116 [Tegillarca granosa]
MTSRQRNLKRKAATAAETKAKRAKGETDLADNLKWSMHGDVIKGACPLIALTSDTLPGCDKVVGFDIDFTVIKPASGRKFATVPQKLREINNDGYRILFFTNQAGIEKLKVKPEEIMQKTFICTGNNHYRKPSTMMWEHFVKKCNQGVKLDLNKCKFVGDAAGRAKEWAPGKPKDFSCGDRMFAANIRIDFQTPEEFFLGEKPVPFTWGSVDPNTFLSPSKKTKQQYHSQKQEVVIMVGAPATGKSTFRQRYLEPHGYIAVNRDTLGTMEKCIKAGKEALANNKSIVADNTNPTVDARSNFVKLAKQKGILCRCFWMKTPIELAHHLNFVRQNQTNGKVRRIPDVGYAVYNKNFQKPTMAEGFSEIIEINFDPVFDSKRDEELFKQWT